MIDKKSFYDLKFKTPQGEEISLVDYRGKLLLLVNTATKCGLALQFKALEELHIKYKDKGLVVIGFPSNDFKNQEPEDNDNVEKVCQINFGVTFQLSEKIHVNGEGAHPVFAYLKDSLSGFLGRKIKWNFTKFLVSPEGKPLKRYSPMTKPGSIEGKIKKELGLRSGE